MMLSLRARWGPGKVHGGDGRVCDDASSTKKNLRCEDVSLKTCKKHIKTCCH